MNPNNGAGPADFRPASTADLIGNARLISDVLHEKLRLEKGPIKLLLYGSPGVGKTELIKFAAIQLTGLRLDRSGNSFATESVNGKNVNSEMIRRWTDDLHYRPMYRFAVKLINEIDTMHPDSQVLMLDYLDSMGEGRALFATSNLNLEQIRGRLSSRLQQFVVEPPNKEQIAAFLSRRWGLNRDMALRIAEGSAGNVRAACLDAQSIIDVERVAA